MTDDVTGRSPAREAALAARLAAIHDEWDTKLTVLQADREAGSLPAHLVAEQIRMAGAVRDRDAALAELEADTGWHTWVGVGGMLYARRPRSSPAKVVRASSAQALRAVVESAQQVQDA